MATKPAKECLKCHSKTRNASAVFCWRCGRPYQPTQNIKDFMIYLKNQILGGIIMTKSIILGIFFIITLAALIVFFSVLPVVFGIWGIIALIALFALVAGLAAALIFSFFPTLLMFSWIPRVGIGIGLSILVLALIVGFTIPLTRGIINNPIDETTIDQTSSSASTETNSSTDATDATESSQLEEELEIVDPALEHGTYPQTQIGHPNFYVETGTNAAYKWTFEVKDKEIGIVGGLVVDGKSGGVYRAYGPGKYTVTVQNGFVLTTQKEWAQNEFLFRVGQAVQYNWSHATIDYGPLTPPSK